MNIRKVLLISVLLLLVLVPSVFAVLNDNSLIAGYEFNNGGFPISDVLGLSNTTSCAGTLTYNNSGLASNLNTSIGFTTVGSYCNITNSARWNTIDNIDVFSWSGWINGTTRPTNVGDVMVLMGKWQSVPNWIIYLERINSGMSLVFVTHNGTDSKSSYLLNISEANYLNKSHNLGVSWNGSVVNGYFDGVLNSSQNHFVKIQNTPNSEIKIGLTDNPSNNFIGRVDSYMFWNRTLTNSEFSDLYYGGLGNPYPFNLAVISVTVNTPVNGSAFFVGNHNYFDVNVSASGFGGNVSTTAFVYNSTDDLLFTYFSQSNPFLFNVTNLSIGTYKINATSWNYSNYDFTNNVFVNRTGLFNGVRQGGQNSSQFTGNGTYINIPNGYLNTLLNYTVCTYFNIVGSNGGDQVSFGSDYNNRTYLIYNLGTNKFRLIVGNPAVNIIGLLSVNFNQTYFLCGVITNKTAVLYENGNFSNNGSFVGDKMPDSISRIGFISGSTYFNGFIFKVQVWNRSLSANEVSFEYSLGANAPTNNTQGLVLQYLLNNTAPVYSNGSTVFNVNLTSQKVGGFENSSITTTAHIYNSTSGSILSPVGGFNSSSRFLFINWSNATFTPVNVTISNTTISLLNDDLTTNRTISSLAGVFNNFTYDLYIQNLSVGRYWIRLQQTDINGNTVTTQNRFNLTTNTLLNISARTTTGSIINNFSINAYNSLYNYNVTINTTNGIAYVDQKTGLINLTIDAEGYSTNFSKASIQVNTANYTYQFTLYETNTFNITFYNQANPTTLLSGINISLDLISGLYAQNYTTQTGQLYLTLLIPETYTIRYYAPGYTTRFYYFTLNNRSYNEIKLYLINNSANYNYTVYVVNQVLNPVEGAIVKNLKYDLATNSYLVQEIGITDVAGKTTFTVTFNDEYYKQVVEYPSGTLKKTTTPDYIDTPSVVIPISLGDNNIVEDVVNYADISGTLVFNNLTDNFRFDWSDTGLVASQYCLEVYRMTGLSQTLYNNSCSSGSSAGTILLGVANGSGYVYYAQATYFEDSVEKYLTSLYYEYPTPAVDEPLGNKYGLFIQLLLTLGMTSLVVLNIGLAMILAPFSLIIGKILGWNVFTWAGLLALQMVGIILAILSSMRK